MELQDVILTTVKAGLRDHFAALDTSQKELKTLLLNLNEKFEAAAKFMGHSPMDTATDLTSPPMSPTKSESSESHGIGATLTGASTVKDIRSNVKARMSQDNLCVEDPMEFQEREALELRNGFQEVCNSGQVSIQHSISSHTAGGNDSSQLDFVHSPSKESLPMSRSPHMSRFYAWRPDALPREILDFVGMIMVLHDAFTVPFVLAWDSTWSMGFWITSTFWTIDLPSQFVTGYRRKDGRLELDLGKAALYYTKTWFLFDATFVLCDWINAFGNVSSSMRYLRAMRLVRGGRQALRFFSALQKYKMSSQFMEVHLTVDIFFLLGFILWVNHVVCCVWYGIGTNAQSDTGWTWTRMAGVSSFGTSYAYSTSLHWALTQMTPASMEVVPECSMERLFNILIIIIGMILGSIFAATLTSSMTQYRLYKERVSRNFVQLQSYLGQQAIEPELSMAFKMHVKNQLKTRQRLLWKNVEYVGMASRTLQEALWHACCMKCIRRHPFLYSLDLFNAAAIRALCNGAMQTVTFSRGDILFEVGDVEVQDGYMYNVVRGHMFYDPGVLAAEADLNSDAQRLHVSDGAFISEAALWVVWKHLGTLFVKSAAEVLQLSSTKLQKALSRRFPDVMAIVVQYSIAFHASLHEFGNVRSDLGCAVDNLYLMSLLETPVRLGLAAPILEQLKVQGARFGRKRDWSKLDKEILEGTCNIGFDDEEPVRTAFVVALKLYRAAGDKRFLVRVGEVARDTGEVKAACVLPGSKRKGKEGPQEALERIVNDDIAGLKPVCQMLQGATQTVSFKNSPTVGVRTRYLRSTYKAVLDATCELDTIEVAVSEDWAHCWSELQGLSGTQRFFAMLSRTCGISWASATINSASPEGLIARRHEREVKQSIVEILCGQEQATILICDAQPRTKCTINLWLTQEEFDILQQDPALALIQTWLSQLQPSESWARLVEAVHRLKCESDEVAEEDRQDSEDDVISLHVVSTI